MFKCSSVQLFRCSGVQVFMCLGFRVIDFCEIQRGDQGGGPKVAKIQLGVKPDIFKITRHCSASNRNLSSRALASVKSSSSATCCLSNSANRRCDLDMNDSHYSI